jgi:hypothetical protein
MGSGICSSRTSKMHLFTDKKNQLFS